MTPTQPPAHDDLRADIAAARRERDEAREAQEYAELELAYLANEMIFNGNSIGWTASKADKYKAALGRAWDALTESGGKCDGNTELADAIRQHFGALSALPEAGEAVAWMVRDHRTGELWFDEICVWGDAGSAKEVAEDMNDNITDAQFEAVALYTTPQPAPSNVALREFLTYWSGDGALQSFEDRERFRCDVKNFLAADAAQGAE